MAVIRSDGYMLWMSLSSLSVSMRRNPWRARAISDEARREAES